MTLICNKHNWSDWKWFRWSQYWVSCKEEENCSWNSEESDKVCIRRAKSALWASNGLCVPHETTAWQQWVAWVSGLVWPKESHFTVKTVISLSTSETLQKWEHKGDMLRCDAWFWIGPSSADERPERYYWDRVQVESLQDKVCPIDVPFLGLHENILP